MKNANRSAILSLAWSIRRATPSLTWSQCQTAAWKSYNLKTALKSGVVHFYYIKADNTLRKAVGTLDATKFEYEAKGESVFNPMLVKYFDLEANAFRACRVDRISKIAA